MIEVIYEKEKEEVIKSGWIPKNIRQIGNPQGEQKIYIEDYVVSYINKMAKPDNIFSRGAILLGETKNTQNGKAIFISGAVEATNLELDMDETIFDHEIWTKIYDSIKCYFPDLEVVGWFLSRLGFSTSINEKIQKTHMENFPGKDKVLYVVDSLEKEDAFYLYEQGRLRKQTGYYIYYERNENMQNYIQNQNQRETKIMNPIDQNDQRIMEKVRGQIIKSKDEKKKKLLPQVVGIIFGTGILAIGITIINNYDRMQGLEIKLERLNFVMDGQEEQEKKDIGITLNAKEDKEELPVNKETTDAFEKISNSEKDKELQINKDTDKNIETKKNAKTNEDIKENVENIEGVENQMEKEREKNEEEDIEKNIEGHNEEVVETSTQNYYYVEKGDTLLSISLKIYHSREYVEDIKKVNGLTDENYIKVGQKLVLPPVRQ